VAIEIHEFQVLVPAGTAKAAPQITPIAIPPRVVGIIEVRIPPGPGGEVGFALGFANVQLFPRQSGIYVVTDNETVSWNITDAPDSGAWQLIAYNTGTYDHTLQVRFLVALTAGFSTHGSPPIPPGQLSG
jgi:hypothetical protein